MPVYVQVAIVCSYSCVAADELTTCVSEGKTSSLLPWGVWISILIFPVNYRLFS